MFHSNCDGSDAITTVPPSMPIIAANSLAFRDEARLRDVWKRRIAVIDAMMPSACPMPMSSRPRTRIQKPPPLANVLEKVSRHSRPVRDVTRAFMVQRLPMTQAQTVRLDVDGALARMTFNRPEVLNAGNARFAAELGEVVDALAAHRDVRVVVMTGAGRAFQTGVDLTALAAGELGIDDLVRWEDAMTAIERMGLVNRVVAAADFAKALDQTVERFLALPPVSVSASKRLSTRAFDLDFETFRREMNAALAGCFESDEHRRAMDNIRSKKRSPR